MRKVILSLVLGGSFLIIGNFVHAENVSSNFTGAMNQINSSFFANGNNDTIGDVRGLIKTYCTVVFDSPSFTNDGFAYAPDQSAFVDLLCSRVGVVSKNVLADIWALLSKDFSLTSVFQDIHYMSDGDTKTDFCAYGSDLSECNISKQVPKLFNMIINDYINLKQPSLYAFAPGVDPEVAANTFAANYFDKDLKICSTDGPRLYPKTCKALKKYMQDAKKTFADVQIFDVDKITKPLAAGICEPSDASYNLLLCGLYGDGQNSLQRFLNLTYNEMFYYRLFVQYYTWMITTKPEILKLLAQDTNAAVFTRTKNIQNELIWSQWALTMSMRMLRDFYTAFPLHIWFLMYQEDLRSVAKPLGSLYTPISQLYYTLQHVQPQ